MSTENKFADSKSSTLPRRGIFTAKNSSRVLAGLTAATLGVSGTLLIASPALADPGYSQASARYLSGNLLGTSLDNVAELQGTQARALFGDSEDTVESNNLNLSVLDDVVTLQAPNGVQIPLELADAGVLGQYAQASPEGNSRAIVGTVNSDGTIGLAPDSANPPGPLRLDLTDLVGSEFTDEFAGLTLEVGAGTATASETADGTAVGQYQLAGANLVLNSQALAGLSGDLSAATGPLNDQVDAAVGPDGSLLTGLTGLVDDTGLVTTSEASLDVDLAGTVDTVLAANQVLGAEGPVTIDLATGNITVDIEALLAANGQSLNDLPANSELLSAEVLNLITDEVDELVTGLVDEVNEAIAVALDAAVLNVNLVVANPVDGDADLLNVNINGTLADIASGTTVIDVLAGDAGLVDLAVQAAVTGLDELQLDATPLLAPVRAIYPGLSDVLSSVLSLTVNNQETVDGVFTETALRVNLLGATDVAGNVLSLNVAQASVGPNALGPDPANPDTVVTGFTPIEGPEAGGTEVTITGTGFTGATDVLFGDTSATEVTVVSDTEILAVAPAGTGAVNLTVTGTQFGDAVSDGVFTYIPAVVPAAIFDFEPIVGPEAGGTEVTITGTGFLEATDVLFGDTSATEVTVVSDTEILAVSPAGTGAVNLTVVGTDDGDVVSDDVFTYIADDETVVVEFSPVRGPEVGGTEVTIIGGGFTGATEVLFGDAPGSDLTVVSDNEIRVTSPGGTGSVPLTVVGTVNGDAVAEGNFTYLPGPTIESVTPNQGPEAGGTVVTIIGTGFTGADGVSFGSTPGTNVTVVSDTTITATAPSGVDTVDITVVGADGGSTTLPDSYTYVPPTTPGDGDGDGGIIPGDGNGGVVPVDGGDGGVVPADEGGVVPIDNGGAVSDGNGGLVVDGTTYANCDAAAAAGQFNIETSDRNLDGDGDGIGCENDATANTQPDNLAYTGTNVAGLAGIAVLALLAGAGVLVGRRKFIS